ncbi:MAG: 2-octaprenyl-6-methoxyphenyl hydroxylase, partial [Halomonas sp.]
MQQSNQAAGRALTHDIVIVGGGLVGASLGCALAPLIERYGWRVAVIESSPLTAQSL